LKAADIKSNAFNTTIAIAPEVWSQCVDSAGKLPLLVVKTTVSLNGTQTSAGTVGGGEKDLSKALLVQFTPQWKSC
jgi:hypothetical protein